MALRVHGLQKAPLSTMVGPSFHGFVLKSKHKHDMQVTWEPDACEKRVLPQITGTAPLVEGSMRHIWNITREESPMINPSGEHVDLWVHNYGDMVLVTVDEIHVDCLPDFWHEYGLDSLGEVADCDWGPLTSLDDRR